MNTVETRRISHELVLAWQEVEPELQDRGFDTDRMFAAIDRIIAEYTPGYNAESDPEDPEEYIR